MTTATLPQVEPVNTDGDLSHWWHCTPDVAYCGAVLDGADQGLIGDDDPALCALCRIACDCNHRCPACRKPVGDE